MRDDGRSSPDAAFEGRALLRDDAMPGERRQRAEFALELVVHTLRERVLRQVLVRAFSR